jgi:ribosomal protein L11 methyltransferase
MRNTIQVSIEVQEERTREELVAQLSEHGFNAFEERENTLEAFIDEELYIDDTLQEVLKQYDLRYETNVVPDQNWNALWESNFQPVVVDNFCAIRADFHPASPTVQYDVVITPKMSFGTGHHATTYMMIREMGKIDFKDKTVADFGTGTGVLAILAEKLGARKVWAIDYDDWSITNAIENTERNNCSRIILEKKDTFSPTGTFDVILANINKTVIIDNAKGLSAALEANSFLLLSGLLREDEGDILKVFEAHGLKHLSTVEKNNWICLLFQCKTTLI